MTTFKELFEAKGVSIKSLPKKIGPSTFYPHDKTKGEYEYTQIDKTPDGTGDYDGGEYNQGYTLSLRVEVKDSKIVLKTRVTDQGRAAHRDFGKKYSDLTFDDVSSFEKTAKKILSEFDKL